MHHKSEELELAVENIRRGDLRIQPYVFKLTYEDHELLLSYGKIEQWSFERITFIEQLKAIRHLYLWHDIDTREKLKFEIDSGMFIDKILN